MTRSTHSTSVLLRPTGALDADSSAELRPQLAAAFSAGVTSIVVDLSGVTSCDQAGLGVLAGAARYLRKKGGALVVVHASDAVACTLRINGLGDLLDIPVSPPLSVVTGDGGTDRAERPRTRALTVVRPTA